MSIIKILYKTMILFVCCIVQMIGVLTEGVSRLFDEFGGYLILLHDKLIKLLEVRKKVKKAEIEAPL